MENIVYFNWRHRFDSNMFEARTLHITSDIISNHDLDISIAF